MPKKSRTDLTTLTLREINRATLARQMLLEREPVGTVEGVERLAGMQAQYSPSPYIGLWTRLNGFKIEDLIQALNDRRIVKASMMRWTLHLASARDYAYISTAITDARLSLWRGFIERSGINSHEIHKKLMSYASEPRTRDEINTFLHKHAPHMKREDIWYIASAGGWLVHAPPSGMWRYFGKNSYIAAHEWLGPIVKPTLEDAMVHIVRRYLAAFGPATRADVAAWSGLRRLAWIDAALQSLGDEVVTFQDEAGKTLYDLASSPRPGSDVPAPVRFLPKWDNLLLAYADRERVLPARYRKIVIEKNGDVHPTFLVGGVVAGMWTMKQERKTAILSFESFEPLAPSTRTLLEEEGIRLAVFIEPDAADYQVKIAA